MAASKINPCLFDKLTLNERVADIVEDKVPDAAPGATQLVLKGANQIERYNEASMRRSVRRELNWLLNNVHLEASVDLERYPQVRTSVLNYGMPDLTGRVSTSRAVNARAADIAEMIRIFEPRLAADKLQVGINTGIGLDNAVSYVIRGDIASAIRAMPVQYFASIEVETGEAVVRE